MGCLFLWDHLRGCMKSVLGLSHSSPFPLCQCQCSPWVVPTQRPSVWLLCGKRAPVPLRRVSWVAFRALLSSCFSSGQYQQPHMTPRTRCKRCPCRYAGIVMDLADAGGWKACMWISVLPVPEAGYSKSPCLSLLIFKMGTTVILFRIIMKIKNTYKPSEQSLGCSKCLLLLSWQ